MSTASDRHGPAWVWVAALSAAMAALNAAKPVHMDDTIYYTFAARIAGHPADPYGGEVVDYWFPPKPAMEVLSPVGLPYAWAGAIAAFGDAPVLWKLWLSPFALLLVGSTWSLARRFARGLEPAVATLVASSPAVLPGVNAMLDVPALALGLAGLAVFLRACDRGSLRAAVVAGVLTGAAIDVKWTGLLAPAVILLSALIRRRAGLGLVAASAAAAVFVGWEGWIAWRYGQSHFLTHIGRQGSTLLDRINGAKALISILGGVAPGVLGLGLVALRRPIAGALIGLATAAGLAAIAGGVGPQAIFLPMGVLVVLNLGHLATVLLRRRRGASRWRGDRGDLFLVLWLTLEVVGYFALSPYAAVRRVLGIVVAATLLAGRLGSRTCRGPARWPSVRRVVLAGSALGLFYFGVDFWEARVERTAARDAARGALSIIQPGRTAWYAGRWGFRHHAEKAGLTHIVPGRTELEPGDLLVVPDNKVDNEPPVFIDPALADEVLKLSYDDPIPFRTVPSYYSGKDPVQLRRGPRFVVRVYRVTSPFTPLGYIKPEFAPKGRVLGAVMQPNGRRWMMDRSGTDAPKVTAGPATPVR